jgi:hypothetical protein
MAPKAHPFNPYSSTGKSKEGKRRVDTSLFFLYVLSKANALTKKDDPEGEDTILISILCI